ncbi:centrosome microtubule-binding domain of Cep57-domain-containing protein [Phellopilus nigrolimitatus]|nr:centrosome microtubule-binding domain of Cep57-domain-containing protein [Phellopilus nigrolimitatus]
MNVSPYPPSKGKARSGTSSATKNADLKPLDTPRYNDKSRSRIINLPDVTGLTSAVGSPPRKDMEWRNYAGGDNGDQAEVQLLQTLTSLQTRLNQLESQNLVSRRRVRELELELEACKAEVKRERTRVLEREEIIVAQQKDFQKRRNVPSRPARVDSDPANEGRYNEVVEEKKALEALIATLRSHLSRLTDELSSQQAQLDELRSLRQCDLRDLRDKISEVDSLRLEVERLGGEVEILRGVVEEGLKERRRVKESMDVSNSSAGSITQLPPVEKSLNGGEGAELLCQPDHNAQDNTTIQPFQTDIPSPPPSRPQSRQGFRRLHAYDRTGCAIAGSSRVGAMGEGRFIDEDELERVSAEVEERRSERSEANLSRSQSFHHPESRPARLPRTTTSRRSKVADNDRLPRARALDEGSSRPPRPTGPTPARALNNENLKVETPFPQIRGDRLERLFFSAPEHNAKTCRVCHRRRRPSASDDELDFPSWLPPRKRTRHTQEDKRSRHRNVRLEDVDDDSDNNLRGTGSKAASKAPFSEDRLPPQTVLVRILRELEDDFTHYKGIYIELADQYKIMDAASNVPKRNVLAEHLKEVINTLEQKGDQIASLYDLLTFKDKPVGESVVPERRRSSPRSPCSPRQSGMRRTSGLRKYATCS